MHFFAKWIIIRLETPFFVSIIMHYDLLSRHKYVKTRSFQPSYKNIVGCVTPVYISNVNRQQFSVNWVQTTNIVLVS